ncbi:MAG: rhomboid family intramembrane serine protease [Trueperaceae bacterium]
MSQDAFFLLGMALLGVYAVGWTRRLAPPWSELPLKTLFATAVAAATVAASVAGAAPAPAWRALAVAVSAAWVIAPLVMPSLARARAWPVADALVAVLYWTPAGRGGVRRLLAQAALQQGDATGALAHLPGFEDAPLAAQAHAVREDWSAVLALGDAAGSAPAGAAARIEAWVALGRLDEARDATAALRRAVESGTGDPAVYRAWVLSQGRLDAERGDLRQVQELLQTPPAGVPADVVLGIAARAAEVAGERDGALRLRREAARLAPEGRRGPHVRALDAVGEPAPAPARTRGRTPATWTAVGVIALAFGGQLLLDRSFGPFLAGNVRLDASTAVAAFVLSVGAQFDVWWRFLSYAFVHGNLVHVGFNLWVLFDIGRMVELRRGPGYLATAFVAGTAMGAYLTSVAQAGETLVLVGASGGVLGVAGALLADVARGKGAIDRALLRSLLQWMAMIVLLSVAIPNVSLWGHVGGVLGGLLWGFARQGLPADRRVDVLVGVGSVLVVAVALVQVGRLVVQLF